MRTRDSITEPTAITRCSFAPTEGFEIMSQLARRGDDQKETKPEILKIASHLLLTSQRSVRLQDAGVEYVAELMILLAART